MTFSVKLGTPLPSERLRRKAINYINQFTHSIRLGVAGIIFEYGDHTKVYTALRYLFDIAITGLAIKYCIHNRSFISYGLMAAIATHYIKWLIGTIKEK